MHPRLLLLFLLMASCGVVSASWDGLIDHRLVSQPVDSSSYEAHSLSFTTKPFVLDKLYMSMTGPSLLQHNLQLLPANQTQKGRELLWLTGVESVVVDAATRTPVSPEFFCHANLTFDSTKTSPSAHNHAFGNRTQMDWRLFTLVPGKMSIHLPVGFGIPIFSDTPLDFFSMSLNQNVSDRAVRVRFQNRVNFVRDSELTSPLRAVYRRALYLLEPITAEGLKQLEKHTGAQMSSHMNTHPGEGCGEPDIGRTATSSGILEQFGNDVTIHWLVPPGVHVYRTDVTDQLHLSEPATIHYAAGHLHPFASYISLVDKSTGQTVIELRSRDYRDRLGIDTMEDLSSPTGIILNSEHRYELVAEYNNTLTKETDAMAILYLYLAEQNFALPH